MIKAVFLIIMLLTYGYMQNLNIVNHENLTDSFKYSTSINLFIDGDKTTYSKTDAEFESILSCLNDLTNGSHEMPAYGVSLDYETKKAIASGVWLELNFDEYNKVNDLPFTSLLIEVNKDFYAFNLIRKQKGGYTGRCFHLSLNNKNMESLHSLLTSLEK